MILEEFVPIDGYEGYYEINRLGQVKFVGRIVVKRLRTGFYKERIMKQNLRGDGYASLRLTKNGFSKNFNVHRLIAIAFIPNPNNYPVVNHINGIRTDNRIENLEWCTQSHNVQHSYNMGAQVGPGKIRVRCTETNKKWSSIAECSKYLGISSTTLSKYLSGQLKNKTTIERF